VKVSSGHHASEFGLEGVVVKTLINEGGNLVEKLVRDLFWLILQFMEAILDYRQRRIILGRSRRAYRE